MKQSRILLADDDPIMRELAAAKLSEAGWDPTTVKDGREARIMLDTGDFDLLITDLEMPHMDGFELTQKLRNSKTYSELPIIVITGTGHSDAVERAFSAGATSFLTKPINWTLFSQSVRFVLRASEDQKALREARDAADAGARFKESLLSMMSHELRTPLNAIIGFSQILSDLFDQKDDHLHREYAGYIVDGGKRLLNSISDILLASDASTGVLALDEECFSLAELFETVQGSWKKRLRPAALALMSSWKIVAAIFIAIDN